MAPKSYPCSHRWPSAHASNCASAACGRLILLCRSVFVCAVMALRSLGSAAPLRRAVKCWTPLVDALLYLSATAALTA